MRGQGGFTLLEILVVVGLTAALMLTSYQIFREITRTQERARPDRHRDLAAQVFLDRFERELLGATLRQKPEDLERDSFPWLFLAEDRLLGTQDADALRFVTQSPARPPGRPRSALRLVSYSVAEAGVEDRVDLLRSEEALPAQLIVGIPLDQAAPALEDVYRFSLRFLDDQGIAWNELWDSTGANEDQLPRVVEVTLQLYEEDGEGLLVPGREHQRLIDLPVRPIPAQRAEADAQAGCPDGPTVQECLARYAAEQTEIDDAARDGLLEAAADSRNGCWNDLDPSPELEEVWDAFETAYGVQAADACR